MTWIKRDVAPGSQEDIEDRHAIVKRLAKLPELIDKETNKEHRRWLMMEQAFLENNGRLLDWDSYKLHLVNVGKQEHARTLEQEKVRLAQLEAMKAADDAIKAKIQAAIDADNDPIAKYRREHSTPTF